MTIFLHIFLGNRAYFPLHLTREEPSQMMAWQAALYLARPLAYALPPRLMASIGESLGRLHLRRGDPPEARKALALGKRPNSPFIKALESKVN